MTFYEAALRILEGEGRPLNFLEITEKSLAQNLLSHVGKTPELTMLSRLAAMARRTRDRKIMVTSRDTFALADWGLLEDVEALALTGMVEASPEESMPPLRPAERHPEPRTENVRATGRGSERKQRRREDEEDTRAGRRRRFPPLPEVVFEILSETEAPVRPAQLLERAREKDLVSEEVTVEAVLHALLEDNQRRIDALRRPQFSFNRGTGEVALERAGAPSEAPPLELQAAFAAALGIPLEGGRPVLPRAAAAPAAEAAPEVALATAARTAVKEARRSVARVLRKRLGELDVGTFEKSVVKTMHALGWRELKVAKRSKEGPLLTARKREGSVDLRYAVRLLKGTPAIERKAVVELRKDLGHYSAQVGLLISAGEVRGDARTEAQATGALVLLWCGDALGEKFLEARAAVSVTTVELFEVDERFFEVAKLDAQEAQRRREERQREKQARAEAAEPEEGEEKIEEPRRLSSEEPQATAHSVEERHQVPAAALEAAAAEAEEDDEEGEDEDLEAASAFVAGAAQPGATAGEAAAAGERKRRRRRRRGRRGRGSRGSEQAAPGAPAEAGAAPAEGQAVAAAESTAPVGEGRSSEEPRPSEVAAPAAGQGPSGESPSGESPSGESPSNGAAYSGGEG